MNDAPWFDGGHASRYGGAFLGSQTPSPASRGHMSELSTVAAAPTGGPGQGLRPGTGMFVFGGLLAVTLGLMAFSTTVRVGPAKASVSVGK